ncbi:MAG: NAD(P)-dependent oxidoreductase [Candidatus Omnitrophota bacterium]|nr:NAD(P)-dependent oxidoreductase [Candidatus Omnitrophota bacterium]
MNNVLVVGGSGFIGSHLVERLIAKGYKVFVLFRNNSDTKFLKSLGVELRFGDLLDLDSLKAALSGVDMVFCLVNVKPIGKSLQEYEKELYALHSQGTHNLLEACRINKIKRLVYLSSVAAIGYRKGVSVYNEVSVESPVDPYGKAKFEAEKIIRSNASVMGIDATILQPPGVFGERGLGALTKIIYFIERGLVPIVGSGRNRQSLTYVGNVVSQAIFVAENKDSADKTYITTDDRPYAVNELVNATSQDMKQKPVKIYIPVWLILFCVSIVNFLTKIFLRKEFINKESIIAIATERIFDGSRIFKELGYAQEYGLAAGTARTIKWYKGSKNA